MTSWKSLAVALAFGIAAVHSGPCKPAATSSDTITSSSIVFETETQSASLLTIFDPESHTTSAFEESTTEIWSSATFVSSDRGEYSSTNFEAESPSSTIVSEAHTTLTIESTTATTEIWTSTTENAAATSTSQAAPNPPRTNLLRNPGFEDFNGVSYSGHPWVADPGQSSTISFGESAARTGASKAYISLAGISVPKIRQLVSSLRVGQPCTLSAWVAFVSGTDADYSCQVGLMIGDKFVKAHVIPTDRPFVYEKVEGTITVLENTALVEIHLACLDDATMAVLIDDVSLTWNNEHLERSLP